MTTETNDTPEDIYPVAKAILATAEATKRLSKCRDMLKGAAADADSGEGGAARDVARAGAEAESARLYIEDAMLGLEQGRAREDLRDACWYIVHIEDAARAAVTAVGDGHGELAACLANNAARDTLKAAGLVSFAVLSM